jgi:putative transposase
MRRRHNSMAFAGSIHFITLVTRVRGSWFERSDICAPILDSFEYHRARLRLNCYAYVLMPDHFHALLSQSETGDFVSELVREFKKFTSPRVHPPGYPSDFTIWSDGFDDVPVPGTDAARTKIEYIHNNPVRKALVESPQDYEWSSAGYYFVGRKSIIEISRPW